MLKLAMPREKLYSLRKVKSTARKMPRKKARGLREPVIFLKRHSGFTGKQEEEAITIYNYL